jgi:RNA polymerase-binding transcription factor DksA
MLSQDFINTMKQRLLAEKERLGAELAGVTGHTEVGDDPDEDSALELEIDEVNSDISARIKRDLEKIDKALAKIEAGTYGTDEAGKEISEARLEAFPWADTAL